MPKTQQAKRRARRAPCPPLLRNRIKAVQSRLVVWKTDALLVSNPRDIRYLTGFIGEDSWAVVSARSSIVTVISDSRFEEQIQREAPHVAVKMRRESIADELAKLIDRAGYQKIALQEGYITLAYRRGLVKKLGAKRIVPVDDGMFRQRAVKDKSEIAAIRQALKIQQQAFSETIEQIKPGQTEQQVAAFLEYRMRSLGADGRSFATIVAADANASLPHAIPGSRKIKKGGVVLIDWGAKWNGYCSDLTRVVAFGKMPPKIKKIYQIVYEAQQAAIAGHRPPAKPIKKSIQPPGASSRKPDTVRNSGIRWDTESGWISTSSRRSRLKFTGGA